MLASREELVDEGGEFGRSIDAPREMELQG